MSQSPLLRTSITALIISALLATGSPALADKPSWSGGKKGGQHEQKGKEDRDKGDEQGEGDRDRGDQGTTVHFEERHRTVIREYFDTEFRSGHCPPGLAKKHNGCKPPGQAKKWAVGRPLPSDVVSYELPQSIVVKLGLPPSGHRYVRVASDILMIAVGTGVVMDAIQDLSR